jgi:transcription-repair coupling factor (superfamily II helicase)
MQLLNHLPAIGHKRTFGSIPDGADSHLISLIKGCVNTNILYVARDDSRMYRTYNQLRIFAPLQKIIILPSWDLLPYDRVSPSNTIASDRLKALCELICENNNLLIITSANSLLQKLPPREELQKSILKLSKQDNSSRNDIIAFLIKHGFNRSATVNEAGEFAVRGSIIDIFASGEEHGWRLDFFGEKLDTIRSFDVVTQISGLQLENIELVPASEIIFSKDSIELFRENFLNSFGVNSINDPLYQAVSEGRKYPGVENWLPLFYKKLDSIFDYALIDHIIFDHLAKDAIEEREASIKDHYESRLALINRKLESSIYYPVPPDSLWLNDEQIKQIISSKSVIELDAFYHDRLGTVNFLYKKIESFAVQSTTLNKSAFEILKEYKKNNLKIKTIIACHSKGSLDRMQNMLNANEIHSIIIENWQNKDRLSGKTIGLMLMDIESGFANENFIIISEQDLLGERIIRASKKKRKIDNFLSEAASLIEGELVVHREHGIGRFEGLETITVSNVAHDCLRIIYYGGDKLYLPVENIEVITRFGSEQGELDKLGGGAWQARKARLKNRIKLAAEELLKVAAERELKVAPALMPYKTIYNEFCARFPYVETDDQLSSIEDVEKDLLSGKPMDRLVCGDVGFGKTEIALRAAFIAVMAERSSDTHRSQVAVVVPTTLLARQHYKGFKTRFQGFDVKIKQLSRMVPTKEATETKKQITSGEVDIVIGTHALLAKGIEFNNLSLLIIDEEQHFGVLQKERLKQLKSNIHVLTLSATPIPRTLQMSLSGIKELSLIATPPVDRLAVRTSVMPFDPITIREAILREHYRGGRIFYVCPRISDLAECELILKDLVPEIKIVIAHGQMQSNKLDEIMNDFYDGKFDLLLSTTIVESGLDVPAANTIFIHRSDMMGLAQLYQLRGRVGRGKIRAYAYLLTHPRKILSKTATKRLEVMQTLDSLGAGFSLASHDMDIRGFGNLVGDEQSGHIREVGIELYQEMLKEAVANLIAEQRQQPVIQEEQLSPQINLGLSVLIPEIYIPDLSLRLGLYRRIANLNEIKEIESFSAEMIDRFGALPIEVSHLLDIVRLKLLCKQLNISKLDAGPKGVVISFYENKFIKPEALLQLVLKNPSKLKLRADQKLVLLIECEDPEKRFTKVSKELAKILEL